MQVFVLNSDLNITKNTSKNNLSCTGYKFLCAFACFAVLLGCATVPSGKNVIASVDGEIITIKDLEYSLEVSHRKDDLSSAGHMNISGFIQTLINDRLIVQEARRMGMGNYPEVRQKIDAYILREAVMKLYNDEVLQKVSVVEGDIKERYRHDYETFTLGVIVSASEEDAAAVMKRVKEGEDFGNLARDYSIHYSKNEGEKILKRKEMNPSFEKVVPDLKPGETSNIINPGNKVFYIVKLIKRQAAPEEEYENIRGQIKIKINKEKIARRSNEYLAELRSMADIDIDREILDAFKFDELKHGKGKWLKDERILVKVNDNVLTVGEFVGSLSPAKFNVREKILNNWIDIKVVDDEALSRKYETEPDMMDKIGRYRNQLFKSIFANKIVLPGIKISEEDVEDYYVRHKKDFVKPFRYKIQKITVKTMEDALDVLNSLKDGASFSWLAKRRSKDTFASKGGAAGWTEKQKLPAQVKEIIDTMEPGEISPVIELENSYMIIRLQEKSGKELEDLSAVTSMIQNILFAEKRAKLYNGYIDKLKKDSQIIINNETVEAFEKLFRK